jgi:hypothetical protein
MNTMLKMTSCKRCANSKSGICGACAKVAGEARRVANDAVIAKGVCPHCGTKLVRNLAIAGWRQCGHYGSPGYQAIPGAQCTFQVFGS